MEPSTRGSRSRFWISFVTGRLAKPTFWMMPMLGGTIHLTMKWVTPRHLEVTYDGRAVVNLQVVRFADVDISLRDISKQTNSVAP